MQIFKAQRIKHGLYSRSQYVLNSGRKFAKKRILRQAYNYFNGYKKRGSFIKPWLNHLLVIEIYNKEWSSFFIARVLFEKKTKNVIINEIQSTVWSTVNYLLGEAIWLRIFYYLSTTLKIWMTAPFMYNFRSLH